MGDSITIAPELPFRQQVIELASHLARSLPSSDQASYREFVGSFESQVKENEEVTDAQKQEIVKSLVGKVGELKGALDGVKESDVESSHLLLQYTLSSTFDNSSPEYSTLVKSVVESVQKGGEASGKQSRVDVASRILNNTYNTLPTTSSLRPTVLLSLLSLLASSSDLSILPLPSSTLSQAVSQWSIPSAEKVSTLTSIADLYKSSDLKRSLEVLTLALRESVDTKIVEKAVLVNLAINDKFELDEILAIQGVKENLGQAASVFGLFTELDEVDAVSKGLEWAKANASWVESAGITGFTAESVVRKLRLIALLSLAAKSETRQLQYAPIAKALAIDESEVEAWVIDAVRSKLLSARISQPLSLIKIQSVSSLSASSKQFGMSEWQLLEKRLNEWKVSVNEAQTVVEEAQKIAEQPLSNPTQRRGQGQGQGQGQRRREQQDNAQQQQQQPQQAEEVAA
ncbi:uncharacterized protein I303_100099 [Kwoniella dejecticola CBS 10117]|uniref:PCI domain-containing protein n=1 Tax=Kwoniella dejecticola CBS 10117 TaxID=1296121 RepID=A0A1A6AE37_9TREE|nr:uncharacterized protein I303_00099 [Kwoniella dejecticola CBS 10117]OBR88288.1 hypothetical protein I303_00099 [Kwoniella dejecticola CBS 10117]